MIQAFTEYLEEQLELTIGTDLFAGFYDEPGAPDSMSVVEEGGGSTPTDHPVLEDMTIGIYTRGRDYHESRTRSNAIYTLLVNRSGVEITGWLIQAIASGRPAYAGRDREGRHGWRINLRLKLQVKG